ncbi:MAG: hypothetical protein KGZ88_11285 [Methylomicrobium sp.]|nr:hypothetical protein [Methylomicrobium sp.]
MAICSRCGNSIEFRFVDGRCVPIHNSGGCVQNVGVSSVVYSGYSRSDESCCFLTNCPECGDEVFFVRFNGGSVWLDPPLGPPWYKHLCMDSYNISTECSGSELPSLILNYQLNKKEIGNGLVLGIVKESDVSFTKRSTLTCFESGKSDRYIFLVKNNAGFLTGKLVIFDRIRSTLTWIESHLYSFEILSALSAPGSFRNENKKSRCPECPMQINSNAFNKHIKKEHEYWFTKFNDLMNHRDNISTKS